MPVFVRKHLSSSVTEVPHYYPNSASPRRYLTVISTWFGGCHETESHSEVTTISEALKTAKRILRNSFSLTDHCLLLYSIKYRTVLLESITNLVEIAYAYGTT